MLKPCVFYKKYLSDKDVFKDKKYNHFDISGRKDAGFGNFIFKAKYKDTKKLIYKKPRSNKLETKDIDFFDIDIRLIDGKVITLKDVFFNCGTGAK